jgi:hypothetical protein
MRDVFVDLPPASIDRLVRAMDADGYAVIPNCLPVDMLDATSQFVREQVSRNSGEYLDFTGCEAVQDTFLAALSQSSNFIRLCHDIYRRGLNQPPPESGFHTVLRCLSGRTGQKHAYYFHFDSYVLTALAPVIMPTDGQSGDLIVFPNIRKIRSMYLLNLIDKLCLDNPLTQHGLRLAVRAGWLKPVRLKMAPGNLYVFWGYRTLHTNEPCSVDKIRSTALIHYADPHADSWLRRKLGRAG